MIPSGSHTAGVQATEFGLPRGTALRYEQPAEALRALISSYAVHYSDGAVWTGAVNWALPGWGKLWIAPARHPPEVQMRNQTNAALGSAMLFGVTSRAAPFTTYGGISVVVDITPLGWARLFGPSAELLRDRITPLDQMVPSRWSEDLLAGIARSDRGAQVKGVLDEFFLARMPPPHPQEQQIAGIVELLVDKDTCDLADAAALVGVDKRVLLQLTKRYFGFPPKTLTMRTRFLRALTTMMLDPRVPDFSAIPPGYHDVSHFIRDAKHFLGQTPRRFLAIEMPYARAVMRARMLVTGSPTSSLDAFITLSSRTSAGNLAPSAGGVIVVDDEGLSVGAVGITGDTSDSDEACLDHDEAGALAGTAAAGLTVQKRAR